MKIGARHLAGKCSVRSQVGKDPSFISARFAEYGATLRSFRMGRLWPALFLSFLLVMSSGMPRPRFGTSRRHASSARASRAIGEHGAEELSGDAYGGACRRTAVLGLEPLRPLVSSPDAHPPEPARERPVHSARPSTSPPLRASVKVYNLGVEGAPDSRWIDMVPYPALSTSSATNPSASTIISKSTFPGWASSSPAYSQSSVPRRVRVSPTNH